MEKSDVMCYNMHVITNMLVRGGKMNFCEELKTVRETLKISQELLARELNVSFATINRLEKGKSLPSYNTLKMFEEFCKKMNIKIEDLHGDTNE